MFTAGYQKAFYIFEPIVSKTNANLKLIATQPPVGRAIFFVFSPLHCRGFFIFA